MKTIHRGLVALALLGALLARRLRQHQRPSTEASLKSASDYAAEKTLAGTAPGIIDVAAQRLVDHLQRPQLDALIERGAGGKPDPACCRSPHAQGARLRRDSEAAIYPQVNGDFEVNRQRLPDHGLTPPPFNGLWGTLYQLQATLDWELDVWGKNRAAYESALGPGPRRRGGRIRRASRAVGDDRAGLRAAGPCLPAARRRPGDAQGA